MDAPAEQSTTFEAVTAHTSAIQMVGISSARAWREDADGLIEVPGAA